MPYLVLERGTDRGDMSRCKPAGPALEMLTL